MRDKLVTELSFKILDLEEKRNSINKKIRAYKNTLKEIKAKGENN